MSRVSNVTPSAYDRGKVSSTRLFPREVRRLNVDFNGLLAKGELIQSASFEMEVACSVAMADPQIADSQRSASVQITAAYRGSVLIRCQVTTNSGNTYNQLSMIQVLSGPWFSDEAMAAGPAKLTVTA